MMASGRGASCSWDENMSISGSDTSESDYEVDSDAESVCSTTSSHSQLGQPSFKVFVSYPPFVSRENIKDHLRVCGLSDNVKRLNMFYDKNKKSKGCGYIEISPPDAGQRAVDVLKQSLLLGKHKMDAKRYTGRIRKRLRRGAGKSRKERKGSASAKPEEKVKKCKVFVGAGKGRRLPDTVKTSHLKEHLAAVASTILEVVVATDPKTGRPKGYGFVFFNSRQNAELAMKKYNGSILHGSKLSLELSSSTGDKGSESSDPPEPSITKVFIGALVDKQLPGTIESFHLEAHFWEFDSSLHEAFIVKDPDTEQSKGYGFACFKSKRAAEKAIRKLAGSDLHGCQLKLDIAKAKDDSSNGGHLDTRSYRKRHESGTHLPEPSGKRVYIGAQNGGRLPSSIQSIHLEAHFWQFKQTLEEAFIVRDSATKQSRGFGFAVFKSKKAAETAVKNLDGSVLHGCQLKLESAKVKGEYDTISVPKSEAKSEALFPKPPLPSASVPKGEEYKVFVGGLRPNTQQKHLQEHFNAFQSDISNVYLYIPDGGKQSRKCGFVVFSSYEAAENAIAALNGTKLHGAAIRVQHDKHTSKPPPPPSATPLEQTVPKEVPATKHLPSKIPELPSLLDTSVPLQPVSPLPLVPPPSNTVLISNLSPMIDESTLKTLCKGIVASVKFTPVDSDSKQALITFAYSSDAQSAITELNGKRFFGQDLLATLQSTPQPNPQPLPTQKPPKEDKGVGILIDLSSPPVVTKSLQLSPSQWNLLTAVGPGGSNLFQELIQPFKTNPNVKIEPLMAEVTVQFSGQQEAVESAYTHFESHLNKSIPIQLEFVKTLVEIKPNFTQEMAVSYGVSVMGVHETSTLLKLDGAARSVSTVRDIINKLIVDFQHSVVQAQLPLTNHLIASARKRLKSEKVSVRLVFVPGSPQEVTVYSFSFDHHQRSVKILSSKPVIKYVPFQEAHTQKDLPLRVIEAEFSVYVAIAEQEEKIYIKGFLKEDVVSAHERVVALVSQCSVQFASLRCTPEQMLYLRQKLKFQKEIVQKVFDDLPAQIMNERSGSLCFKGLRNDIELSQKKLLEGPLFTGLLHQSFMFMTHEKFYRQLEKQVLQPLKKERTDFEYVRTGSESTGSRRKRQPSEKGEESEINILVFSQTPEIFEEAVSLLEDITPCSKTLKLLHSSAMECVNKDIEDKEKKYRVRIVVPKDSTSRLIIFGLTEREVAQCYNDLNETIESTVEAAKYVKIDYNQLKYFQQKKTEEWEELRGMCKSFKVYDKQKQENDTALVRVQGTMRQVRTVCKRLDDMRELDFYSKSFTVSVDKRHNKMWLKFWQAFITEKEESRDIVINLDPPKKLLGTRETRDEYEIEYTFSVCGSDESATNDTENELSNTESVQRVIASSEFSLGEIDKGRKEKKLEINQFFVNVHLDFKNSRILLTAPESCREELDAVEGEIERYLSKQAIEDREITVSDPVLALMLNSKSKSHLTLANKLSKPHGVSVQCLRHPKCGLKLRGNKEAVTKVEPIIRQQIIKEMKATIGEIQFPINSSLLPFFDTPDFSHCSAKIRDELSVIGTFPRVREENKVIQSVFLKTSTPDTCIKLEICQGDITNEEVDAIVNAANEDLQHIGGLALAIANAGGESIQRESNEYIQKHGKVNPGRVVCLGAGNLSCKKVVHAVGPRWVNGRNGEEQTLYFTVLRCLQLCSTEGIESVAIPALSTGIFSVPDHVCIQASLKAVRDFCQMTVTTSSLTNIRFVLLHTAVAQRFARALDSDVMLGCVLSIESKSPPAAAQSSHGAHTWEWMADDGSYLPYQPDTELKLNDAYSKDPNNGAISFSVGRQLYIVEFTKMVQTNLKTAKVRQVRRVPVAATPTSPSSPFYSSSLSSSTTVQWEYVSDDGRWTPYTPSDSQAIETMFQSKVPGELTIKGRVYTFDFTHLYQVNVGTGHKRHIKRSAAIPTLTRAASPEVSMPEVKMEKRERKAMVTLRGPRANLTVAKSRIDEKLEGALDNGNISFPSSIETKVINIVQQYKLEFKIKAATAQKGKMKKVTFEGLSVSVSRATSEIQDEIINYHAALSEQSGVTYPDEWMPQTQNLQLFAVVQGSSEWSHVVDNFKSTLSSVTITDVTRIQNKWLWERYVQHKRRLEFKNNGVVNEKELFHGTRENDPKSIYEGEDGFDMRFSRNGMWGLANYFAVNAKYSDNYAFQEADGSKAMFMVKVLTGDSFQCPSNPNLRMPPEKPVARGGNMHLSKIRYDTVTGTTHGSQVFMTYDNDKAYPAYLIRYRLPSRGSYFF